MSLSPRPGSIVDPWTALMFTMRDFASRARGKAGRALDLVRVDTRYVARV